MGRYGNAEPKQEKEKSMKMKITAWIGCLAFISCLAQGAAEVDDFETFGVGDSVVGANGWTNKNTTATQGASIAANESAFSSGSMSLRYLDADSGGTYDPRIQNVLAESLTQGTFSFDFNMHAGQARNPAFFIRDSYMGTIGLLLNFMDVNGKVRYHNGSGLVNVSETVLSLDTWYRVELIVNDLSGAADTFDIRVLEEDGGAGTEIINVTGLSCSADIASMAMFEFATNSGANQSGADLYLDNVFPVTLAARPLGPPLADDFESHTVSNSVYGVNGWTMSYGSTSQNVTVAEIQSDFGSGSQAAHYVDQDNNSAWYNLRMENTFNDSTESVIFTFDYRIDNANGNPTLFMRDSDDTIGILLNFFNMSSKTVKYNNAGVLAEASPVQLSLGTWYRAEITVSDLSGASDTFDLRILQVVEGAETEIINVAGLGFKADVTSLKKIDIGTNANPGSSGADFYVDNILQEDRLIEIGTVSMGLTAANMVLGWQGNSRGSYTVQCTPDLLLGTWSNVVSDVAGIDGMMWSTNDTGEAQSFYRVIVE
jgi:hypothetical protein